VDVNTFPHGKAAQFCRERQRRSIRRLVAVNLTSRLSFLTFLRTRATLVCSISDVHPVSRLLVHHEDSPLQGKIYPARNPSAAAMVSGLQ